MLKQTLRLSAALVVALMVQGCGDGGSGTTTLTPAPTPTPSPTPTPTPASVSFTTTSTGTPVSGTITDPDGSGTIASLVIDGDETIAVSGGATYRPGSTTTVFSSTTETFTAASGDTRVVSVRTWQDSPGSQAGSKLNFYGVEKGAHTSGQTANGDPITGAYLIELRPNLATPGQDPSTLGTIGDAASALPTTGTVTYRGESIGFINPTPGSSPLAANSFIGTVTITIDYSKTVGAVTGHIDYTQFDPVSGSTPFTVDFTGDMTASGLITSAGLTLTGLAASPATGSFQGQLYGSVAPTIGGALTVTVSGAKVSGALLAGR